MLKRAQGWGLCRCLRARSPFAGQQLLASGSQDQTIRLWAIAPQVAPLPESDLSPIAAHLVSTLSGHTSWIRCLAFSPDGTRLASGSSDGIIILWDVETGDRLHAFQAHSSLVLTVTFSPSEDVLASSGGDGIIKLWHLSGSSLQPATNAQTDPVTQHQAPFLSSPPSSLPDSPPLLQPLHGHQNWVRFLAYSPDGKLLASCSQDGTVKLWDEKTAACLETLRVQRPYEGANITGATGLTAAQKNTLKLLGAIEHPVDVSKPPSQPVLRS
jgi:predicted NACHT family NTPase